MIFVLSERTCNPRKIIGFLNINFGFYPYTDMCQHCILSTFPSPVKTISQACYSGGIRTHDTCNSRAISIPTILPRLPGSYTPTVPNKIVAVYYICSLLDKIVITTDISSNIFSLRERLCQCQGRNVRPLTIFCKYLNSTSSLSFEFKNRQSSLLNSTECFIQLLTAQSYYGKYDVSQARLKNRPLRVSHRGSQSYIQST